MKKLAARDFEDILQVPSDPRAASDIADIVFTRSARTSPLMAS